MEGCVSKYGRDTLKTMLSQTLVTQYNAMSKEKETKNMTTQSTQSTQSTQVVEHYIPVKEESSLFTTPENLKLTLERHGVAIIPSVLDSDELDTFRSQTWDFFENITKKFKTPLSRDNKETWKSFYDLYPNHGMLVQHWGIGHAPYIWNLRQNRKIVNTFATLWGVKEEDLLVSFDGAALSLPHERTKRGYYRGNKWYHFDQRLSDPEFRCVQSWITANEVKPGDATLTVLEGSHLFFGEFAKRFELENHKTDWYKMGNSEIEWLEGKGCVVRDISCPEGSMVFWDSRTAHAGKEAIRGREREIIRDVVYLCYTPRSFAKESDLKKKRKAYEDGRTTSHWPHRPKLFPKHPRTYGKELPEIVYQPVPELDELGRRLAGYE